MSDIRTRREIEIGIDREVEEIGIDRIEGEIPGIDIEDARIRRTI
ncbi:hypothetical protein [Streptacidiphilus cavernicola]|uniref:DUF2382 domain-containing protein n=1 Tax=Streptacidiphilus cavernicola TaxID=3342716 RepID=A0ABV6W601_9ACTN